MKRFIDILTATFDLEIGNILSGHCMPVKYQFPTIERTYSIEAVSKAMNLPCGTVISILRKKGFDTSKQFRTPVTIRMRDVLADEYVNTLHSVFDTVISDQVTNFQMVSTIISFFKIYKYDHYSDLENSISWAKIDEDKIRQDFFNHVDRYNNHHYSCVIGTLNFCRPVSRINRIIRTAKEICKSSISEYFYNLLYSAPSFYYFVYNSYDDGKDIEVYYGVDYSYFKNQTYNNYKINIIHQMTSYLDPTSSRSHSLTTLTQSASSGTFVRQVMLPHRYCIFGTSDDDDHIFTHTSECNSIYKHCSIGMRSLNYDTFYHRA